MSVLFRIPEEKDKEKEGMLGGTSKGREVQSSRPSVILSMSVSKRDLVPEKPSGVLGTVSLHPRNLVS